EAHVATQARLLAGLDAAERAQLDGLLRQMQAAQSPPA
ncbi:MAG: MarR family transcriptional regulator, partial [Roseovarius sp.]|nr:MarR family transcriptional regulator [Roseovarius sp.]